MALVRVYCGLASADGGQGGPVGDSGWLTAAVVDDAGRLLDVCEIGDDAAGYATLGTLLAERSTASAAVAVAADSDDHLITMLLTAAGRPLAVADDDAADDFAERFADDESLDEIQSQPAERRAVGLARALQAGALSATAGPAPRDLVGLKPVLAAHSALAHGRHAAAVALREVLRELYPAALRAYPDPAEAVALAVLDALPEPGMLTAPSSGRGRDTAGTADAVAAQLAHEGVTDQASAVEAVTALRVAIAETPRRAAVNRQLTAAISEAVRQSVAAVRACDAAAAALIGTLSERVAPPVAEPVKPLRQQRSAPVAPAPPAQVTPLRPTREPSTGARRRAPVPVAAPPVAPVPVAPRVFAPAAQLGGAPLPPGFEPTPAVGLPVLQQPLMQQPVLQQPVLQQPVLQQPVLQQPVPQQPVLQQPVVAAPLQPTRVVAPVQPAVPVQRQPERGAPVDSGVPFVPAVTQAAINSARAERFQDERPVSLLDEQGRGPGAAEIVVPLTRQAAEPGDRANWPLVAEPEELAAAVREASGRVTPPWLADDLVLPEAPSLRLVEPLDQDLPPIRVDANDPLGDSGGRPRMRRTAMERIGTDLSPPPVADEGDGDLLIFSTIRSAWFTGPTEPETWAPGEEPTWNSLADQGWRAAERAERPSIGEATGVGLPRRVPQANLVPGSPINAPADERPLRIVRDAERIAEHTSGYFRGWRRGQEVNGYAVGGRPGRESAGGWEFSRDNDDRGDYDRGDYDYRSAGNYGR